MDGDQDFVTITMDPHRVIVVLVFIDSRCELNIDVLGDTRRNHSLLLVANLKVVGLRGQNVQSLRRRRIINQSKFHRVSLVRLEASEFHNTW